MEDGGIESESIVRPPKIEVREREDVVKQDEQDREKRQKVEEEEGGGGGGGGGGLLDNLLSKLASPRTPKPTTNDHIFETNGSSDHHDTHSQVSGDVGHDGRSKSCNEGGGGGGVIDKLSSFFHRNAESEGEDVKNNNNDSHSEEGLKGGNEEVEKTNNVDQESENGTTNGGSSFISNLVPELMAPEGDEASILIHSVVHD